VIRRPPPADLALRRRWVVQHLLLGLLQLGLAVAAVLSIVLAGTTDLAQVTPITWLLVAALAVVSVARFGLYFARGRPNPKWLEPEE
jgi:hypothetical protein